MSSDLLAEFDSFYKSAQNSRPDPTPASNDLSSLDNLKLNGQFGRESNSASWSTQNVDIWGGGNNTNIGETGTKGPQAAASQSEDLWGIFEGSVAAPLTPTLGTTVNKPEYRGASMVMARQKVDSQNSFKILRRPTLEMFSNNIIDISEPSSSRVKTKAESVAHARPAASGTRSHGEVLFDAAEELSPEIEDDDDFGDFETVTAPSELPHQPLTSHSIDVSFGETSLASKSTRSPQDLLSTSTGWKGDVLPYPQAPKSPSFKERNPFSDLELATNQNSGMKKEKKFDVESPLTIWPTFDQKIPEPKAYEDSPAPNNPLDDDWGDFSDMPPEEPPVISAKAARGIAAEAWAWDAADQVITGGSASINEAPPTNIPPPSILLTLFPQLFDLPQNTVFKIVANQPFSLKNRIMSDPSTIEFLRAYLLICTVAAHIIAGRKLRWKRDTVLSQAMKIGPAATGGRGGMKLAGVDKAEVTREDREAADVVRVWRDQLGRLRSAVAAANANNHDSSSHLTIPEISESMHVKTQEGALTAPKPCIICGMRREERINKVDVQVEDSFGEWWVEHWGHRTCRNFWLENESKLKYH